MTPSKPNAYIEIKNYDKTVRIEFDYNPETLGTWQETFDRMLPAIGFTPDIIRSGECGSYRYLDEEEEAAFEEFLKQRGQD